MDTTAIIVLVVLGALLVLGVAALIAMQQSRSKKLRGRFGSEYDEAVAEYGDRGKAEKALREREQRVEKLHIVPLSKESREGYAEQWKKIQARFVDDPAGALGQAHEAITKVMNERGYPASDYRQQIADVSVEHSRVAGRYREAYIVSEKARGGDATTEELRRALQDYKALFEDLLEMRVRVEA